jgi:hypothetical protein
MSDNAHYQTSEKGKRHDGCEHLNIISKSRATGMAFAPSGGPVAQPNDRK